MKRITSALVGSAVVLGGFGAVPAAARADWVVECSGQASSLTVRGTVLVPDEASCVLDRMTVIGDVIVGQHANLIVTDSVFQGNVDVRPDGYLDAVRTRVTLSVTNVDGFGVSLVDSQIEGSYHARGEAFYPFVDLLRSAVGGSVEVRAGLVELEAAGIAGSVISTNSDYTDVYDSTIEGDIRVESNSFGALFCTSEVDGATAFERNAYGVQLGGNGKIDDCGAGAGYWGGNLTIAGNTGAIEVSNNIVRGDLAGTGNDPPPVRTGNRVRGTSTGQFADPRPAAGSEVARSVGTAGKRGTLEAAKQQRRAGATNTAAAEGRAAL